MWCVCAMQILTMTDEYNFIHHKMHVFFCQIKDKCDNSEKSEAGEKTGNESALEVSASAHIANSKYAKANSHTKTHGGGTNIQEHQVICYQYLYEKE